MLCIAGFSIDELISVGYPTEGIVSAGYSAKELREENFTVRQLLTQGFDHVALKMAGYTAAELEINADDDILKCPSYDLRHMETLDDMLMSRGLILCSPVFEVEAPLIPGVPALCMHPKCRALIWEFIGIVSLFHH